LKTSDVATGEKLAEAIRATKYAGLLGNFVFDDTGVGIFATAIGLIQGGKLVSAG
jgi:branched-chain amino acid transport system substrate-binding protein